MKADFHDLVKATLLFAKKKQKNSLSFFGEKTYVNKKVANRIPSEKIAPVQSENVEPILEEKPIPLVKEKKKEPITVTSLSEMKALFQKIHPQIYRSEIPAYIYLVSKEEKHLPFLNKVSEAITETLAPSKVFLCKTEVELQKILKSPSLKLLIGTFTLVNEKAIPHKLTEFKNFPWLPLDKIENYIKDSAYKRSLWNTLRSLPLNDLLQ